MEQSTATIRIRVAKAVVACVNFAVDVVVILVVAVLLGFGVYSIWDTNQIYTASDAKVFETYKPAADEEDSTSFAELQAINPDVLGWITIYGTGIDYPIVQGENNDEYLNTTATGEFSLGGAIFLDWQNAADFSDYNTIIYGHHMAQSEMFGDIDRFDDEEFFRTHQYANLYYGGRNHGLVFFAMVDGDAYDFTLYNSWVTDASAYLSYLRSIARYWREEAVPGVDGHIVMLSTCADTATNGRYVLFGRIDEEIYEDTFVEAQTIITRTIATAGSEGSMPIHYLVIALVIASLLLILVFVVSHMNKVRAQRAARRRDRQHNAAVARNARRDRRVRDMDRYESADEWADEDF